MSAEPDHSPEPVEADDVAPGDGQVDEQSVAKGVLGYVVGLTLAAGLSAAAFILPATGLVYTPALPTALVVIAIAQMGVHLVFFLHLSTGPDNTNNVLALAFGLLIVFLVMAGSLWIMANLNHNMVPMDQVMQMQR